MSEPRKVDIAGIQATVVSDEEAEQAEAVVCGGAAGRRYFADDIETVCHDCGKAIIHRPYAPKKPPKLCIRCALARMEGGKA